jgi:hypothetical protein
MFARLMGSVVVEHVQVQFPLKRRAGKGQFAAVKIANDRTVRVRTRTGIKFCVKCVAEEKFDDELSGLG